MNFLNGAVAGTVTTLLSQPFDTIKTRSQSAKATTTVEAVRGIWNDGGIRALWRGTVMRLSRTVFSGGCCLRLRRLCQRLLHRFMRGILCEIACKSLGFSGENWGNAVDLPVEKLQELQLGESVRKGSSVIESVEDDFRLRSASESGDSLPLLLLVSHITTCSYQPKSRSPTTASAPTPAPIPIPALAPCSSLSTMKKKSMQKAQWRRKKSKPR